LKIIDGEELISVYFFPSIRKEERGMEENTKYTHNNKPHVQADTHNSNQQQQQLRVRQQQQHTQGDRVAMLLTELVDSFGLVGSSTGNQNQNQNGATAETRDAMLRYCHRILTSKIGSQPPSQVADERHLCEVVKRRMVKEGRAKDALAFEDLHRRWVAATTKTSVNTNTPSSTEGVASRQRWAVLHLLNSLSNQMNSTSRSYNTSMAAAPVPVSIRLILQLHLFFRHPLLVTDELLNKKLWYSERGLPSLPPPQPLAPLSIAATPLVNSPLLFLLLVVD